MDPERYRHDRSAYERPGLPYRCGRAGLWSRPCARGPNPDGSCGGTAECTPFRKDDRYHCRRPQWAGGPCAEGPLPDGSCSQVRPPCVPRPSLRRIRGRLTVLAAVVAVAVLAVLAGSGGGSAVLSSIDPGPLSGPHANFAAKEGCGTCHVVAGKGAWATLAAVFEDDSGLVGSCVSCHAFAGAADAPHNRVFPDRPDVATTTCVMCHTEHRGVSAEITEIGDDQCQTCHKVRFPDFAGGHPPFPETFPYERRPAIRFDHLKHFNVHFERPQVKDKAPRNGCVSCHDVATAGREVTPAGFEENCAACHSSEITRQELTLISLPDQTDFFEEREEDAFVEERETALAACGLTGEEAESLLETVEALREAVESGGEPDLPEAEEPDLEGVGDELVPVAAYLLDVPDDDPEAYGPAVQRLLVALVEGEPGALAEAIEARGGDAAGPMMAGLNPELLRRVACAWLVNREYEAPADPVFGGWYADELTLKYRPAGHGDPVVRAWLEFALSADGGGESGERAEIMRETLFSETSGPGACAKCHSVSSDGNGGLAIEWRRPTARARPHTVFVHAPHLDLLGPGKECVACHRPDEEGGAGFAAAYKSTDPFDYVPNFRPISAETCTACHAAGQVRQDCQLCHRYHEGPTLRKNLM